MAAVVRNLSRRSSQNWLSPRSSLGCRKLSQLSGSADNEFYNLEYTNWERSTEVDPRASLAIHSFLYA